MEFDRLRMGHRGSATVEATVVIALIFLVIQAFVYLSFYLFNVCSVTRAAQMAALRASSLVWESPGERYDAADAAVSQILSFNLIGEAKIGTKITSKAHRVSVEIELNSFSWKQTETGERNVVNPVLYLREARKIKRLKERGEIKNEDGVQKRESQEPAGNSAGSEVDGG